MSDPKVNDNDNDELLLDSLESDGQMVDSEELELGLEEDFFADDDQDDVEEQQAQGQVSGVNYKRWLHAAIVLGVLALLIALLLSPIVGRHEKNVGATPEVINAIDIVNLSAAQSLTVSGDFRRVNVDKEKLSTLLNDLLNQNGVFAGIAQRMFGSSEASEQVNTAATEYLSAADSFVEYQTPVSAVKQGLIKFNQAVSALSTNSLQFVEAVAKEGRNKNSSQTKDR